MNKVNYPFGVVVNKGNIRPCEKLAVHYLDGNHFAYVHGLTLYLAYQHRCRHQAQ